METQKIDLSSLKIDRSEENRKRSFTTKTVVSILLIVALIVTVILIWKSLFTQAIEVNSTSALLISTSQSNAVLTASGYVVAQRKAAIASKGTGRLVYLGVVEGDKVKLNQIIARIEDSDIKAQLEQAKANLKMAEADLKDALNNYERQKKLFQSGSTTQIELDAAESRYLKVLAAIEVAKAMVLTSEVALENTLIRAPFNGTVLTKNADIGEIVAPFGASVNSKSAVVTIADMTSLQVEADVSESNIQRIAAGQECEITLDAYPNIHYAGYVDKIVPTADRSKATVMVKVGFKNYDERVLPEMGAKVLFLKDKIDQEIVESKPMLVVLSTAVVTRNGKKVVFKIQDDVAIEVEVKTGSTSGDYIEIISGLLDGDKIIDKVSDKIKNGVKVKQL
jgi:RND family efflux transporter MFP subunit